jgi:hypothetical protein
MYLTCSFIRDLKVKPLPLSFCIRILPHIQSILELANFYHIIEVSTLKLAIKSNFTIFANLFRLLKCRSYVLERFHIIIATAGSITFIYHFFCVN